jgi:hypothetical protein
MFSALLVGDGKVTAIHDFPPSRGGVTRGLDFCAPGKGGMAWI